MRELLGRILGFFLPKRALLQSPAERRQLVRARCRIPASLRYQGRSLTGWIVDLGVQGIRLRTSEQLKVGTVVTLRPSGPNGHTWVECRVLWSRPAGDRKYFLAGAGLPSDREQLKKSWVYRILLELGLKATALKERRGFLRLDGRIPLRLESSDEASEKVEAETLNLGVSGVLIRSGQPLYAGKRYRLWIGPWKSLPRIGPFAAEVMGCRPDPSGTTSQIPLRFLELEEETVEAVGQYLLTLLKEQ